MVRSTATTTVIPPISPAEQRTFRFVSELAEAVFPSPAYRGRVLLTQQLNENDLVTGYRAAVVGFQGDGEGEKSGRSALMDPCEGGTRMEVLLKLIDDLETEAEKKLERISNGQASDSDNDDGNGSGDGGDGGGGGDGGDSSHSDDDSADVENGKGKKQPAKKRAPTKTANQGHRAQNQQKKAPAPRGNDNGKGKAKKAPREDDDSESDYGKSSTGLHAKDVVQNKRKPVITTTIPNMPGRPVDTVIDDAPGPKTRSGGVRPATVTGIQKWPRRKIQKQDPLAAQDEPQPIASPEGKAGQPDEAALKGTSVAKELVDAIAEEDPVAPHDELELSGGGNSNNSAEAILKKITDAFAGQDDLAANEDLPPTDEPADKAGKSNKTVVPEKRNHSALDDPEIQEVSPPKKKTKI